MTCADDDGIVKGVYIISSSHLHRIACRGLYDSLGFKDSRHDAVIPLSGITGHRSSIL